MTIRTIRLVTYNYGGFIVKTQKQKTQFTAIALLVISFSLLLHGCIAEFNNSVDSGGSQGSNITSNNDEDDSTSDNSDNNNDDSHELNRGEITIDSFPSSLKVGSCSESIKVTSIHEHTIDISLSSSNSSTTFHLDDGCLTSAITTTEIEALDDRDVWFRHPNDEEITITLTTDIETKNFSVDVGHRNWSYESKQESDDNHVYFDVGEETFSFLSGPFISPGSSDVSYLTWWNKDTSAGGKEDLYLSIYDGNSWGENIKLTEHEEYENSRYPSLSIDPSGNTVIAYTTQGGNINSVSHSNIHTVHFDGTTIDTFNITDSSVNSDLQPSVIAMSDGDLLAVYNFSGSNIIYAYYYNSSTESWSTQAQRYQVDLGNENAVEPKLAIDSNDNIYVYWTELNTSYPNQSGLWLSIFEKDGHNFSATDWSTPIRLSGDSETNDIYPKIIIDAQDNAHAVWCDEDLSSGIFDIFSRFYDQTSSTWQTTTAIESESTLTAINPYEFYTSTSRKCIMPDITINSEGNAMAVFSLLNEESKQHYLHVNTFDINTKSWGTSASIAYIENGSSVDYYFRRPEVVMDAIGNATVLYTEVGNDSEATSTAKYNEYFPGNGWNDAYSIINATDISTISSTSNTYKSSLLPTVTQKSNGDLVGVIGVTHDNTSENTQIFTLEFK